MTKDNSNTDVASSHGTHSDSSALLAPDHITESSSPEDVREAWMLLEQERSKLKKERDMMEKERKFLLEALPPRRKSHSTSPNKTTTPPSNSSKKTNKSNANDHDDDDGCVALSPINKESPPPLNFKLRSCLCGRGSDCHALSTSFYCIQDPRCLYTTLPKGGMISTLRLSYLLHILPPGKSSNASAKTPSLFGDDEDEVGEPEETNYIALHHFHPEIIKWSYNSKKRKDENKDYNNKEDEKSHVKLPKYITKHDLEELDIDFSEYDRVDEMDFEDDSNSDSDPHNDEEKSIDETKEKIGDDEGGDNDNHSVSNSDGQQNQKQRKEAYYVVPNYPFELATIDLQKVFTDRGILENEEEKDRKQKPVGRTGTKANLTDLFTKVHKCYEEDIHEENLDGSENNVNNDDGSGGEGTSGTGSSDKQEQEIANLLINKIEFPPLPSEEQPSSSLANVKNKVSSTDMHMTLLAYESKRRAVYSFLSDSSFAKQWQAFIEHHIRAGIHEVARTKRFILGLTSANGTYAEAIKAIANDVFLDDNDHEVLGERKQKNLATKRNTNPDDEFNETYMGDILYGLIQSQTTLGNGFQQSSDTLREDICEKVNQFYIETKAKADEVEQLAASIFSDLKNAEAKVYTTWKVYDTMMVGEEGLDVMNVPGLELYGKSSSSISVSSAENVQKPLSSRNISSGSNGEDSAEVSNSGGDDSNHESDDIEEKKPSSSAKSGTLSITTSTETDVWIYQMHYRVAVTYQALAWKLGWKELRDEVAKNERERRLKLEDILRLFVSRHLRLFAGIQSAHTPMLQELVGKFTTHDELEQDLGETFQGLDKLSADAVGIEESGITPLESPMLNCDSKVVEVKTRMRWYRMLAVVSDNSFLHIFDIPIKEGGRLTPEEAFLSLLPSLDIRNRSSMARSLLKTLSPWETYFLPRTTVKRSNKVPREVTLSESRVGVVRKTSTRTMRLRCDLPEEAVNWLIEKGCLLPADEGVVSYPADDEDKDEVSLYSETVGSSSPPAKDIFKFLHAQAPELESDDE